MQEQLSTLQTLRKRYQATSLVIIAFFIASVAGIFINWVLTLLPLIAAALYYGFFARKKEKAYTEAYTDCNLKNTVCKRISADAIAADGGALTAEQIRQTGLLPIDEGKGSCLLFKGISGRLERMPISVCDAVFAQSAPTAGGKRTKPDFAAGCWVQLTLPYDTGAHWVLMDKAAVTAPARLHWAAESLGMEAALPADAALAEQCLLYGGPLPEAIEQQLRQLVEYTPGRLVVGVQGQQLSLYLRDRLLARGVKLTAKPTEAALSVDPMPELEHVAKLAKTVVRTYAPAE